MISKLTRVGIAKKYIQQLLIFFFDEHRHIFKY